MKKVSIKKSGIETHAAKFETLENAESSFYQISSTVEAANASYAAPGGNAAMWFVAAGAEVWGDRVLAQTNYTGVVLLTSSALVYLNAGQTLGVATDASPTTTFTTSTARNVLSIHKVGL